MKFARYLQDTQTPEWKKAYIAPDLTGLSYLGKRVAASFNRDYRALKAQLRVIRTQAPQLPLDESASSLETVEVDHTHHSAPKEKHDGSEEPYLNRGCTMSTRIPSASNCVSNGQGSASPVRQRSSNQERPLLSLTLNGMPPRITGTASNAPSQQTPLPPRTPRSPPVFPFFRALGSTAPPPLHTILSSLPAAHAKFFDVLDAELEKVETFYAEREKEMNDRAKLLREQLNELGIHRQRFHQSTSHSKTQAWARKAVPPAFSSLIQWLPEFNTKPELCEISSNGILASESGRGGHQGVGETSNSRKQFNHKRWSGEHSRFRRRDEIANSEAGKEAGSSSRSNTASSPNMQDVNGRSPPERSNSLPRLSFGGMKHPLDPSEYQHAKRRLRKAVVEHYRGLELLNNFRILNLTGFRKALKKYEKITKYPVLDAYMKEKVEPSAFASGAIVVTMLKETEDLFATRFEHGDRKKALDRLRAGLFSNAHHFSTFRSGMWLGLALPAIIEGVRLSFLGSTRRSLPSWNILLFIYSIFVVPILLALLIGLNLAAWARERINYVFIFELNPRSRLDHHEYFELPSFLFFTLSYAFVFSLSQLGPPTLWPLIWLALTAVVMFIPIRSFMWGLARWWIIKKAAKLGASGMWKVEFADFWLGDQVCSLIYSISNLYFVGCFYARSFELSPMSTLLSVVNSNSSLYTSLRNTTVPHQAESASATRSAFQSLLSSAYDPQVQEAWTTCGVARNWGWYYLLSALPFTIRFVQSLRRYRDSKLPTHLINAGKYGMGLIYYFMYYYWKHRGNPHHGTSYILLYFTGVAYSMYGCAWDLLMDWSMFKPHARYPLLRPELVYKSHIPSYYFALISNLCIRFVWLIYPPDIALNPFVRSFIGSILEMLRRVQWNFFRIENEHLGNVDQYRVTHEVPLPYNFDLNSNEEDEEREETPSAPSWLKKRLAGLRRNGGHG